MWRDWGWANCPRCLASGSGHEIYFKAVVKSGDHFARKNDAVLKTAFAGEPQLLGPTVLGNAAKRCVGHRRKRRAKSRVDTHRR
jgi:hypothetical protein